MKVSDKGLEIIKEFEGLSLKAYPDPATGGRPWTIGYGHTEGVTPSDTCTQEEADKWLREDCSVAEECIEAYVDVELTQNQYDALISFIFNLGCGNFKSSTLLRLLNQGLYDAAAKQFKRWDKAAGVRLAGLTRRRGMEANLFMEA